jgi:DNA-binding winged helix-turn-helix (wHTH) protein/tetratricopeptide (TPR) repeat protein
MSARFYLFGPFRLDVRERQLACDGRSVPLRGKLLDTLCFLVQHAGQLARRDELMKAVWPDRVVEENNLEHNLCVLRKMLGRSEGTQKFIETIPGEGYRFVPEVRAIDDSPVALPTVASVEDLVAERESELQQLQLALKKAQSGMRQMVFVTGEEGIGKTTVVRRFLAGLRQKGPAWIGLGQCLDQRGPAEAYMPLLEAFGQICGQTDGRTVVEILQRRAPTWLLRIPSATGWDERMLLQQSVIGLTQERMLREGTDALQAMATDRLLIVILEDLHWSDGPTLDFLLRVAQGREPAKLLIIGTYSPAEAKKRTRSVVQLVRQLRLRDSCRELPLRLLSQQGIASYLHRRLGGPVASDFARLLYLRTEGNPLFAVSLMNSWIANGSLREDKDHWTLSSNYEAVALEAPDTLRLVIEEQLDQLPLAEQEIVEAASLGGVEFSASTVAAALNRPIAEIESQCAAMALCGQFFVACGQSEWPDGTICQCYRFEHSLYREVIYRRLPAGLRVRWNHQIGERLEKAFAGDVDRIAGPLAEHFRQGRDARRAIHYLKKAAQQSLERGAPPDAVLYLTQALDMLRRIPEPPERMRLKLGIDALLAPALGASQGFGDLEAETAFRRSYELARQLGEQDRQLPIIFGFAIMLELRGHNRKAQEVMEKYLPREELDGRYIVERLDLLACSRFHQGAFAGSLTNGERGAKAYCPRTHSAIFGQLAKNPGIDCHIWMALSLWFLGYPDQALKRAKHAMALAEDDARPSSLASVWAQRAFLHQLRGEKKATRFWAERSIRLAAAHGLRYREAVGKVFHGWAQAQLGHLEPGIAELREGIAGCDAAGAELDRPFHLALLADAYIRARNRQEATATLRQALEQTERAHSHFYEAELWRMQGDLQLAFASDYRDASECFVRAIDIAQSQQARSLELRAAVSMARLSRSQLKSNGGGILLAQLYRSFTGGRENSDLRDARLELEAHEANTGESREQAA